MSNRRASDNSVVKLLPLLTQNWIGLSSRLATGGCVSSAPIPLSPVQCVSLLWTAQTRGCFTALHLPVTTPLGHTYFMGSYQLFSTRFAQVLTVHCRNCQDLFLMLTITIEYGVNRFKPHTQLIFGRKSRKKRVKLFPLCVLCGTVFQIWIEAPCSCYHSVDINTSSLTWCLVWPSVTESCTYSSLHQFSGCDWVQRSKLSTNFH